MLAHQARGRTLQHSRLAKIWESLQEARIPLQGKVLTEASSPRKMLVASLARGLAPAPMPMHANTLLQLRALTRKQYSYPAFQTIQDQAKVSSFFGSVRPLMEVQQHQVTPASCKPSSGTWSTSQCAAGVYPRPMQITSVESWDRCKPPQLPPTSRRVAARATRCILQTAALPTAPSHAHSTEPQCAVLTRQCTSPAKCRSPPPPRARPP